MGRVADANETFRFSGIKEPISRAMVSLALSGFRIRSQRKIERWTTYRSIEANQQILPIPFKACYPDAKIPPFRLLLLLFAFILDSSGSTTAGPRHPYLSM